MSFLHVLCPISSVRYFFVEASIQKYLSDGIFRNCLPTESAFTVK